MPHLLELFSGTGSMGRAFEDIGWEVTSVDLNYKSCPTIHSDVLELTAGEVLEYGNVTLIWASPPCTMYSVARTYAKTPRDLEGSDRLVAKVLDLADELNCYYIIENPHSGLLKTRPVVQGIPMKVVDYCRYGAAYRKRTALWTHSTYEPARPLCNKDCASSDGKKHTRKAQRSSPGYHHALEELYAIPPALCKEVAGWADGALS